MALTSPAWAPLVSFTLLIVVLLVCARRDQIAMRRRRRGDPRSPAACSRCFRWLRGCRPSTSRSCTSCSTGSCSPRRGTSCRGYSGYFSFGHGAFFGAGMYTTATLGTRFESPFLATLPAGGAGCGAAWASRWGRSCSACKRVRGELFALADAGVHVRRRHDRPQHADRRRAGRLPERVPHAPKLAAAGRARSTCWRSALAVADRGDAPT